MYRVIKEFADLQNNNLLYRVGDEYRPVSKERTEELASSKNKRGVPLIELVEEETPKKKGKRNGKSAKPTED